MTAVSGRQKSGKNKEPTCQTTKPRGALRTGPRSTFKNNMKWITGASQHMDRCCNPSRSDQIQLAMTHVHFVVLVREPNRKTVFADGIAKRIECGINRAANAIWHYCRKKQAKQSQASLSPDEQFIRRNQCIVANAECFRTTDAGDVQMEVGDHHQIIQVSNGSDRINLPRPTLIASSQMELELN